MFGIDMGPIDSVGGFMSPGGFLAPGGLFGFHPGFDFLNGSGPFGPGGILGGGNDDQSQDDGGNPFAIFSSPLFLIAVVGVIGYVAYTSYKESSKGQDTSIGDALSERFKNFKL